MFHSERGKEVSPRRWPLLRFVDTKIGHGAGRMGGWGRKSRGWGDRGGIALGEIPDVDDGEMDAANHHHGKCIAM